MVNIFLIYNYIRFQENVVWFLSNTTWLRELSRYAKVMRSSAGISVFVLLVYMALFKIISAEFLANGKDPMTGVFEMLALESEACSDQDLVEEILVNGFTC